MKNITPSVDPFQRIPPLFLSSIRNKIKIILFKKKNDKNNFNLKKKIFDQVNMFKKKIKIMRTYLPNYKLAKYILIYEKKCKLCWHQRRCFPWGREKPIFSRDRNENFYHKYPNFYNKFWDVAQISYNNSGNEIGHNRFVKTFPSH